MERDEEADLTSRAKEKRRRVEEETSMKRRKRQEGPTVWGESVWYLLMPLDTLLCF